MQYSQIYFSDNNQDLDGIILNNTKLIQNLANIQGLDYRLYTLDKAREFLDSTFGTEVKQAFDTLAPYSYKADLVRYCLLYKYGGWYFDLGVRSNGISIDMSNTEALFFKDAINPGLPTWDTSTAVIYSNPRNTVFKIAIELICENVKNRYYGFTPLSPTGPTLLGRALAIAGERTGTIFGHLLALTPNFYKKNHAFLLPDGTIIAWGKDHWGNADFPLSRYGAPGTNNYSELYRERRIYL